MARTSIGNSSLMKRTFWSELRVIWAIVKKNLKVRTRYRADYFLRTIIPLTLIVWCAKRIFNALTFGPTEGLLEYIGTLDFVSFAVISNILMEYYLSVIEGGKNSIRNERMVGTLEMVYTCPVGRTTLIVGFCISDFISFMPSIVALSISTFLMGVRLNTTPLNFILALAAFILSIGGCLGLGFIIAGLVAKYREPGVLDVMLASPLWYFSGDLFSVSVLPLAARLISYTLPTAYGLDIMRGLLLGTKTLLPIPYEILVLLAFAVLLPLLGILIFKRLEKSVIRNEGIGAY